MCSVAVIGRRLLPLLALLGTSSRFTAAESPVVVVQGPVIIAFHDPITQKQLEQNPDANEELSDFQIYAADAREPLRRVGIAFQEVYARSFRVRLGTRVTTFRHGQTGYYFIAPGKKPRVVYGVTTHPDLFQIAKEYFGILVE